jgi:glycosyltransferase involved in cell wall biosynthesis
MQSKKTNIFLGGFINYTNAQNLNCLALAKHLDKEKFNCYSLELYSGNLESQIEKTEGLRVFKCFYPVKISMYLGFLWGIWHCDVAYLPKGELWKWNKFWLKVLRKKSFSTIEGILDEDNLQSSMDALGSYENVIASRSFFDKQYPISNFLGKYNIEKHHLKIEEKPLYLGCDTSLFSNLIPKTGILKKIIFIGRLKKRKGIYDFLKIAESFPEKQFFIFGNGEEQEAVALFIKSKNLINTKLMGTVNHKQLAEFLIEADLHVFPSRSEGFPKVILETAAAGIPTIMYNDYGANEWINHSENGWVVSTAEEMILTLNSLIANPELLQNASSEAIKIAVSFDWKIKIKDWEIELEKLVGFK